MDYTDYLPDVARSDLLGARVLHEGRTRDVLVRGNDLTAVRRYDTGEGA